MVERANKALDNPTALARLDAEFHLAVAEAGGNSILLGVMLNLLDLLADARKESLSIPGRPARSAGEHHELAEAIFCYDVAQARELMLRHLTSVEESIMAGLEALRRLNPADAGPVIFTGLATDSLRHKLVSGQQED